MFLHYSAHPEKRSSEFKRLARRGFGSELAFRKEYELDFTSLEGARVFNEFSLEQVTKLEMDPHRPLYCSTDWGFVWPAHVITQFNERDQWLWHRVFVGSEMLTPTFLEVVKWLRGEFTSQDLSEPALQYILVHKLNPWIEYPSQFSYRDYCDSAGLTKSDKSKESNISIARQAPFNLRLQYKKTNIEMGINLMCLRMRKRSDGQYGTLVDESCKALIEGLTGGFVRDRHGYILDNYYTNPFDSLRYILVNNSNERIEQVLFAGKKENWTQFIKTRKKPYADNRLHSTAYAQEIRPY